MHDSHTATSGSPIPTILSTILVTGLGGVGFALLRVFTGSLFPPAALHWAMNGSGVVVGWFVHRNNPAPTDEPADDGRRPDGGVTPVTRRASPRPRPRPGHLGEGDLPASARLRHGVRQQQPAGVDHELGTLLAVGAAVQRYAVPSAPTPSTTTSRSPSTSALRDSSRTRGTVDVVTGLGHVRHHDVEPGDRARRRTAREHAHEGVGGADRGTASCTTPSTSRVTTTLPPEAAYSARAARETPGDDPTQRTTASLPVAVMRTSTSSRAVGEPVIRVDRTRTAPGAISPRTKRSSTATGSPSRV